MFQDNVILKIATIPRSHICIRFFQFGLFSASREKRGLGVERELRRRNFSRNISI